MADSGRRSRSSGSRGRVAGDSKGGSKRLLKPRVVDFTPEQNRQKITFCLKGHVFELSVPEAFVLNHVMLDVMKKGGNFVGLYTDFNSYKVGWVYGPIQTNIEQICVE